MDKSWKTEQHLPQPVELHDGGRQLHPDISQPGQYGHEAAEGGAKRGQTVRLGPGGPLDPVELGAPGGPSENDVVIHSLNMKAGLDPPQVFLLNCAS